MLNYTITDFNDSLSSLMNSGSGGNGNGKNNGKKTDDDDFNYPSKDSFCNCFDACGGSGGGPFKWGSIHTAMIVLLIGEICSVLAVVINILDTCKGGGNTLEFGMFTWGSDNNEIEYTSYWDDCADDTSDDSASCSWEWRGLFWLVFVVIKWIIYIIFR